MDLARGQGIEVIERHILPDELAQASEVFLTGTAAEITPVSEIAGQKFPIGPMTQRLIAAYQALVRA
jgi:branched-chain amino acid aminotransferase